GLVGLSQVFEKRGNAAQAVEYVKRAIDLYRDDVHLLLRCASLQKEISAYDEALDCVAKAAGLKPLDPEVNRMRGDLYLAKGDRDKAWESYGMIVDSLIHDDRIEDAILLAKQFKDVNPVEIGNLLISLYRQKHDDEALYGETLFVAGLLLDSGMQEEALEHYREALRLRPDDLQLKRILAEQEMSMGIQPSDEEREKTTDDLLTDADIFIKYGLCDEARSILEELKVNEPGNVDVHRKLRSLYLELNDKELAVTECLILFGLYGKEGNTAMREAALMQAAEISPDDPRVVERLSAGVGETAAVAEGGPAAVSAPEPPSALLDDYGEDIAEAEFYVRQGLKDDALRIYHKLLTIFPGNRDLIEKVSSLEGGVAEPAVRDAERTFPGEEPAPAEAVEAHEIEEVVEPQFDTDVLDIFEEFKKGLEKELDAEDSETHYNLGIAYNEMGLVDDAIKEFQTSRNDPKCSVRSATMLGICYMEKGLYPLAIDSFREAIGKIETRDEAYWSAHYDLATAYEKNGNLNEAFGIFSDIYGWNSKFREVAEKLNYLKSVLPQNGAAMKQKEKKDRVSYI
ncbi:MAG: tetratricopeptide repeat protein, partial [Nitrospirae bacterium]|nr:tetratricopeptide repeat protein [Nitrospirota bacterium]